MNDCSLQRRQADADKAWEFLKTKHVPNLDIPRAGKDKVTLTELLVEYRNNSRTEFLRNLTSAMRKVLTEAQIKELRMACDPVGTFLEEIQNEAPEGMGRDTNWKPDADSPKDELGHYIHVGFCNGDRHQPPGTKGDAKCPTCDSDRKDYRADLGPRKGYYGDRLYTCKDAWHVAKLPAPEGIKHDLRSCPAMRALESLTPMGSEYVDDIERCVEAIKATRTSLMKALVNAKKAAPEGIGRDAMICDECGRPDNEHAREGISLPNASNWEWKLNACPIGEGPFHPTKTFRNSKWLAHPTSESGTEGQK